MTSQINPTLINAAFPVAGINQPSQGFRDNFAAIQTSLGVAKSEITNIHNTTLVFDNSGDILGVSNALGTVSNGQVSFLANLKTIPNVAGTYNGSAGDISFTIDANGRVTTVTSTSVPGTGQPTSTVYGPVLVDENGDPTVAMGTGSGTITLPTMRYDAQGRAVTPGTQAYSFGLLDHDMQRGTLLGGSGDGLSSIIPPPPNFTGSYYLTVDDTAESGLKWATLVIPDEGVVGFSDGPGIDTSIVDGIASISIDIDELPTMTYADLNSADKLFVLDSSASANKSINWGALSAGISAGISDGITFELVNDTSPQLGGDLDVNGHNILGTTSFSVRATAVNTTLTLSGPHLVLQGPTDVTVSGGSIDLTAVNEASIAATTVDIDATTIDIDGATIVTVDAPTISLTGTNINATGTTVAVAGTNISLTGTNVALNGQKWPVASGTIGQYLTTIGAGQLGWTTSLLSLPRTLFVAETAFGGNNTTGTGALDGPYATVTRALQAIPNNSNDLWTIMILGGTYSENITISQKKNITIEGFFYANKPKLTGLIELSGGIDLANFQNLAIDSTARASSDITPGLSALLGSKELNFNNCDFLRGIGSFSDLPMIMFQGDQTGNVSFDNCLIQGRLYNQMTIQGDYKLTINNSRQPGSGHFSLETQIDSVTRVQNAPRIRGVRHRGGILEMENISGLEGVEYTISVGNPPTPMVDGSNNPFFTNSNPSIAPSTTTPVNQRIPLYEEDGITPREALVLNGSFTPIQDGFEEDGTTPKYKTTLYQQAYQDQPDTTQTFNAGIYSTAPASTVDHTHRLLLRNVNLFVDGEYGSILKTGECEWKFEAVSRRNELDTVVGPRIAYDVSPDSGQFIAHYTAVGTSLRYADDASLVADNQLDPQAGNAFHIVLNASSTITLKTPVASAFAPGPLQTSGEQYSEVMVAIKQDATGGRSLLFAESGTQGITWLTSAAPSTNPNSYTFYLFRYFASIRKWIGQRQSDGGSLKIVPSASATYTLTSADAGTYVRRNNASANTVIVPIASSVNYIIGTQIHVVQTGNGRTSIEATPGVAINTPDGLILRKKFSRATLTKVGTNIWDLSGDLDDTVVSTPSTTIDSDTLTIDSDEITADNG